MKGAACGTEGRTNHAAQRECGMAGRRADSGLCPFVASGCRCHQCIRPTPCSVLDVFDRRRLRVRGRLNLKHELRPLRTKRGCPLGPSRTWLRQRGRMRGHLPKRKPSCVSRTHPIIMPAAACNEHRGSRAHPRRNSVSDGRMGWKCQRTTCNHAGRDLIKNPNPIPARFWAASATPQAAAVAASGCCWLPGAL